MPYLNTTYRKLSKVNGKIKENILVRKTVNNNKEIVRGHYGKTPIYFRTNFKTRKSNKSKKYRR
jgi:pyruvate/oxaloacetate carboxyltransferase